MSVGGEWQDAIFGAASRIQIRLPRSLELIPPYTIGCVAMFWVIQQVAGF